MNSLSVLMVTYKTKHLVDIAIRSFEKYKPENLTLNYHIVEASDDTSYKEFVESLAENVTFTNHPEAEIRTMGQSFGGSFANAYGLELGKEQCKDDYTFVCHSDICVTSPAFFSELQSKVEEGYQLIGMSYDSTRINAVHISGLLVKTKILKESDTMPQLPEIDVGDRITENCRNANIPYFVFPCTFNDPELVESINEPFKSLGATCGVDRTLDSDNNIMYMHLGRGTTKQQGRYYKSGKISHDQWLSICNEALK
jgi:hypothetical protein